MNAPNKAFAAEKLYALIDASGIQRLTLFLELLDHLGSIQNMELLASNSYQAPLNTISEERILKVCRYVHDHFQEPIELKEIARLANMNPSSFCRFFKKSTGQTLFDYINDLRIGKACNLLLAQREKPIAQIAYEAGFNSQTLFNRTFMQSKAMTPSAFRRVIG